MSEKNLKELLVRKSRGKRRVTNHPAVVTNTKRDDLMFAQLTLETLSGRPTTPQYVHDALCRWVQELGGPMLLAVFFLLFSTFASAQSLEWDYDQNATNVASFRIYLSTTPGIVPDGASYNATIAWPTRIWVINTPNGRWYAVVTAVGHDGTESSPSNELEFLWPLVAPGVPQNLRIVIQEE